MLNISLITRETTTTTMVKLRASAKKKSGIVILKTVVKKLQKSISLDRKSNSHNEEHEGISNYVPEDVKEGHFAVIAVDGDEPKRFVVPLICLTHPTFLILLEQAAEEYGFNHEGVLTIPCTPNELGRVLAEHWQED